MASDSDLLRELRWTLTVVRKHAPRTPGTVAGVASERDVLVLTATCDAGALLERLDARGVAGKQLHVAAFDRGPAEAGHHIGASGETSTLVISRENLHDEDRLRADLETRFGGTAPLVDGLGAVSVIGAGINATYANVRRGSGALHRAGIQPCGLHTSSFRITWLLDRASVDRAVRLLHEEFLEGNAPAVPLT